MNISEARAKLADALSTITGAQVYPYVPEMVNGPAFVIQPGSPFLEQDGFCTYKVHFTVTALADVSTNEVATDELDGLVWDALQVLDVESVSEPFVYQSVQSMHLAADLSVSDTVTI